MFSSKAARMVKYLSILAIVLGAFILPAISQAAETASPVIYQSCYQGAPVVEIAWPTPSSGTRAIQVEFSSYVSFYQAVSTGPLPGDFTSTVYLGLADATRLWYRVGYLQPNADWHYSEGQQFTTPNCKLVRIAAVAVTSNPGTANQTNSSGSSTGRSSSAGDTSASSNDVEITSVNSPRPGQTAVVSIVAAPNTTCTIEYVTPAGNTADAQGLGSKRTDSGGKVSWSWMIGTNTKPGTGTINVQCGDQAASASIEIAAPSSSTQIR